MSILYTYPEYVRPQMLQNQVLSIYGCPQAESAQLSQGQQCLPTSPFELRGIIRRARSIELRGNFCFAQYGRMIIWRYGHETASIPGLNLGPGLKLEALRTLPSHTGRLTESKNASLYYIYAGSFSHLLQPSPTPENLECHFLQYAFSCGQIIAFLILIDHLLFIIRIKFRFIPYQ